MTEEIGFGQLRPKKPFSVNLGHKIWFRSILAKKVVGEGGDCPKPPCSLLFHLWLFTDFRSLVAGFNQGADKIARIGKGRGMPVLDRWYGIYFMVFTGEIFHGEQ